ncbi:MAG: FAD:protein FMN transferase [Chloroflexi bacterium]|nr:FAD:protein FMN transferase [Chloroflexota bacterium]
MTRRTDVVMGMPVTVAVPGGADARVLDAIFAELRVVDAVFSPFRADSAVSRMNAGTLAEHEAGALVAEVLDLCRRYACATHGYFSAWATGRLDPSGLVKGWALDRACAVLERAGHTSFFVDGAGDVRTRGHRAPGVAWRVAIRHPVQRDRVVGVIRGTDLAVATSGTYEKGTHIYDPHTRRPANELVSLTVVGPDIVDADVYATAAFAMGRAGLAFMERVPGYEAFAIDADLFSASTSGFGAGLIAATG